MNRLDGYVLTKLSGETYLLPYGQNIAAFRRGLKLNETGAIICQALLEGKTKEELPALLAAHFEAEETDTPLICADIDRFLAQLQALGILDNPLPGLYVPTEHIRCVQIGTMLMQLNMNEELIPEEFLPFTVDARVTGDRQCERTVAKPYQDAPAQPDLTVSLRFGQPRPHPVGNVLIHSEDLLIIETTDRYHLVFLSSPDLIACQLDKEGKNACFYCRNRVSRTLKEELFHGIRFAFLYSAVQHDLYAIHSASILYNERAWLFSAPSGTGKSTHAKLWQDLYDTLPLNGDLNLLGMKDGHPVVYGLPWCGTSGIFTNRTYPLGGVIFLHQSSDDTVQPLAPDACTLMLSQRLISPTWTKEQLLNALDFCTRIQPQITCFDLHCTPNPSAATVCKAAIDRL